ncbi:hypothetical protein SAMN04488125_1254 [Methylorubrum salsuginis]|uniref:Uncharacterized protein n=1 Tax=Methylorubrum salsuginis TaxID=414703 RepID=A0A1I4KM63_9HYPH|nr:hypothetical protein SAMN04488125_1254 [Methylorubrum salsuginis]
MRAGRGGELILNNCGRQVFTGVAICTVCAPGLGELSLDLGTALKQTQMTRLTSDMLQLFTRAVRKGSADQAPVRHRIACEHDLPNIADEIADVHRNASGSIACIAALPDLAGRPSQASRLSQCCRSSGLGAAHLKGG